MAPVPGRAVTLLVTAFTMLAFAANSLLCRAALGPGSVDAASFTLLRIGSGAALLGLLAAARRAPAPASAPAPWISGACLFLYAAGFSFAYGTLETGTGALLLFGTVQATMIVLAHRSGERFRIAEGIGFGAALAGLLWLVAPGVRAPSPGGAALMIGAGIAWGFYSLRGRGIADPLGGTARNFAAAVPMALALSLVFAASARLTTRGVVLAVVSGAVTSGLGYVLWYHALRGLTWIRAAIVQLAVPAIAAAGGVVLLGEPVTARLVLSGLLILGGVAVAVAGRERPRRESDR
ncbi:MAG TPA: DMT family transporter [Acidobacteriota bacterium]|nr:DMT family transporter [Acidobacteriota bacterium]